VSAYYNEIDAYPAQWLRNLSDAGHIAAGRVDERSIRDVVADDVAGFRRAHFFAGIGVWDYALRLAGWGDQEVWTGSCPCQPFSSIGKRRGTADGRHLWPEWLRLIRACRPGVVMGEQVAGVGGVAWLDAVSTDLEREGYAVWAADLCAAGVGAPQLRQRLFFVAHAARQRCEGLDALLRKAPVGRDATALSETAWGSEARDPWGGAEWIGCRDGRKRPAQPGAFPLVDGATSRVGELRAYGGAIVPQVAATFIRAFMEATR
jgi:DNA (cytosine-5)-methyltransferase 1